MNKKFIVALDEGTTSTRTLFYNYEDKTIKISENKAFEQIYPVPGYVEHNAEEIWEAQLYTLKKGMEDFGISPEEIAGIGITNQRETVVAWDKLTGKPLYNAIVWQCRRTADICEKLIAEGYGELIKKKTGLLIDAYFSGTKIKWLLDNVPAVREKADKGELMVGTIDTWLIYKLSGGKTFITDYSNASRTMLFNIHTLDWDDEILKILNIPKDILPKAVPSVGIAGYTDKDILGAEIPISGIGGDQQCALFGQGCFKVGSAKNTYGTGCFILMNTGENPVYSKNNLLTTIAWGYNGKVEYALEGSVYNAGSIIKWLRDELNMIEKPSDVDTIVEEVADNGGVYLVPAFTGLGAPFWDMYARGTIVGLTRGSSRKHIIRAAVESIAFQAKAVFDAMIDDAGVKLAELKVDGGVSVCDFMLQFQADLLNTTVIRPKNRETTGMGAVFMAGLGVGVWKSLDEIKSNWELDRKFEPSDMTKIRDAEYKKWQKAVLRAQNWEE